MYSGNQAGSAFRRADSLRNNRAKAQPSAGVRWKRSILPKLLWPSSRRSWRDGQAVDLTGDVLRQRMVSGGLALRLPSEATAAAAASAGLVGSPTSLRGLSTACRESRPQAVSSHCGGCARMRHPLSSMGASPTAPAAGRALRVSAGWACGPPFPRPVQSEGSWLWESGVNLRLTVRVLARRGRALHQ